MQHEVIHTHSHMSAMMSAFGMTDLMHMDSESVIYIVSILCWRSHIFFNSARPLFLQRIMSCVDAFTFFSQRLGRSPW